MENPDTWDRLTASLAQFLPAEPDEAWEFLISEGFARAEDHDAFVDIVNSEDRDDTGPSRALRVANKMGEAGLVRGDAYDDDPTGETAAVHASAWRESR